MQSENIAKRGHIVANANSKRANGPTSLVQPALDGIESCLGWWVPAHAIPLSRSRHISQANASVATLDYLQLGDAANRNKSSECRNISAL